MHLLTLKEQWEWTVVEDKEENWPVASGMTGPRGLLALIRTLFPTVIVWPGARVVSSHSGFIRRHLHRVVFTFSQQSRCLSLSEVSSSWLSLVTGSILVRKPLPQGSWQWIEEEEHMLCLFAFFWGGQLSRASPTPEHRSRTRLHPPEGPGFPSSQLCTLCSE